VEVIVFSDHGNDPRHYRRANLEGALERVGFRLERSLKSPASLVAPLYGLVGAAVLYTQPGREAAAAAAARAAHGVALTAYRRDAAVVVENNTGRARIERAGERYAYRVETGDPPGLASTLLALEAGGLLDVDAAAEAAAWAEATAAHHYPDPLRRMWRAFDANVQQPASVVVSFEDGYYFGSPVLDFFAVLRATHGNLGAAQSLAFALRTGEPLPAVLRGEELWSVLEAQGVPPRAAADAR
jgi:hypothetical protein